MRHVVKSLLLSDLSLTEYLMQVFNQVFKDTNFTGYVDPD